LTFAQGISSLKHICYFIYTHFLKGLNIYFLLPQVTFKLTPLPLSFCCTKIEGCLVFAKHKSILPLILLVKREGRGELKERSEAIPIQLPGDCFVAYAPQPYDERMQFLRRGENSAVSISWIGKDGILSRRAV
jgi:hypothetical protein